MKDIVGHILGGKGVGHPHGTKCSKKHCKHHHKGVCHLPHHMSCPLE